MFIDTHCHLDFDQYDEDREQVIQRAIKNNIDAIISIGTDIHSSRESVLLSEKFATIYAAVGIHPSDSQDADETMFRQIEEMADEKKVVAIGEIGLDYYRMYAPKDVQEKAFRAQLRLSKKLELPVIIHNRDAHEDVLRIALEEGIDDIGGVFHSFNGSTEFLDEVIRNKFHVSFTGAVTFKNARYENLLERVPVDNLLLETDSPFLAPMPFRGKRNEPGYIKYTAEKIAGVKKMPVEELAQITSANARMLFKLTD